MLNSTCILSTDYSEIVIIIVAPVWFAAVSTGSTVVRECECKSRERGSPGKRRARALLFIKRDNRDNVSMHFDFPSTTSGYVQL